MKSKVTNPKTDSERWQSANVTCPKCDKDEYVYMYDDNHTLYCLSCNEEFDLLKVTVEGKEITGVEVQDITPVEDTFLSSEFAEANAAADAELARKGSEFKKSCNELTPMKQMSLGITADRVKEKFGRKSYIEYGGGDFDEWNDRGYGTNTTSGYSKKFCNHPPQHIIAGKNSWGVWAGRKFDCKDVAAKYNVVFNLTGYSIKQQHNIPIRALSHWEWYQSKYEEIVMDWPDYGTITLPRKFWEELVDYLEENKKSLLVFCEGGHGRTGTALGCLLVVAFGWTAERAIEWIRSKYCSEAIESIEQENYIKKIAKAGKSKAKKVKRAHA